MRIGTVASNAGVGVETVRFYERKGLIDRPTKPENGGFRSYSEETINRIRFVRQAQDLGFSLITRQTMHRMKVEFETLASRVKLPYFKTAILMAVIAAMFASQGNVLFESPALIIKMIGPGLAFFFGAFLLSLVVGRLFRLNYPEVALLAFTTTARNSEASLAIAVTAFASPLVALTVVIGPSIELPVLILLLRLLLWLRERHTFSAASSQ